MTCHPWASIASAFATIRCSVYDDIVLNAIDFWCIPIACELNGQRIELVAIQSDIRMGEDRLGDSRGLRSNCIQHLYLYGNVHYQATSHIRERMTNAMVGRRFLGCEDPSISSGTRSAGPNAVRTSRVRRTCANSGPIFPWAVCLQQTVGDSLVPLNLHHR